MPTACSRSNWRATTNTPDRHPARRGWTRKTRRLRARHRRLLGRPLLLHGEEIVIKACIGIADYPEHADDYSELMRRAMLVAITGFVARGDANVAYFDPQHDRAASHRMMLERQLRAPSNRAGSCCPISSPSCAPAAGA